MRWICHVASVALLFHNKWTLLSNCALWCVLSAEVGVVSLVNPVTCPSLQEALPLRSGRRDVFVQEIKYKLSTTTKRTRPTKIVWEWDERKNETFLILFSVVRCLMRSKIMSEFILKRHARCVRNVYSDLSYLSDIVHKVCVIFSHVMRTINKS